MRIYVRKHLQRRPLLCFFGGLGLLLSVAIAARAVVNQKSITSTSQNRSSVPAAMVGEQPITGFGGQYRILGANDLGMHCGDLDHRIASILPPFNVLHAQVVRLGSTPVLLDATQVELIYSAASNPNDPAAAATPPASIFKTNFWDPNPRGTGNTIAFDAYNAYYPPGVLPGFPLLPDVGLPVPDLQRLYFGDGQLAADRQAMPSSINPSYTTNPYVANVPQKFSLFYARFPFFMNFPFGYALSGVNWFSAEGIPATPFDDAGRPNPYPLMRVQARAVAGNTLGLSAGTVVATLDVVTPVSGEVSCGTCHTSAVDGGNGLATDGKGFPVATRFNDPKYGAVPQAVSLEYAYDLNVVRLHDAKHGTNLAASTPVSCQRCHYTPALDLAHLGPQGPGGTLANGREQNLHRTFSNSMHSFHGSLTVNGSPLFPAMPSPVGRSTTTRDNVLAQTCYQCHPGKTTKCFRGAMANAGAACQDCHGNLTQIGNDFSRNVSASNPGAFLLASDYYTNPSTPRVPWANEPMCQSCHTGDALNNLSGSSGVVQSSDGIRLLQAYRTPDSAAKPIVAVNRLFAENQTNSKQVLYRLSKGHGGLSCEGCHGSTHAEWPNANPSANDNVAAKQLQGHTGKIIECATCHPAGTLTLTSFQGNFAADGRMKGPHGMHPVGDPGWVHSHEEVFNDYRTPAGNCQACHGTALQGTPLARMAVTRTMECKEANNLGCKQAASGLRITLTQGTQVSCNLCHPMPGSGSDR